MGDNDRPRSGAHSTRSNPNIDPAMYQLLYEVERRLDERFREARTQNKEDIAAAFAPVLTRLDGIDQRLDEGNKKFDAQEDRSDDHSSRIQAAEKLLIQKPGTALEKKKDSSWVSKVGEKVLLPVMIGALTTLGSLWVLVQIKLIAFADTTAAVAQPQPQPKP